MEVKPCKQTESIQVKPWTMIEGLVTEYKIDALIWIQKPNPSGNVKQNYFVKWLKQKKAGDIFLLDEFFKLHPKHKTDIHTRDRLDKTISNLIQDGKLDQWTNTDEFKVLKL